MSALKPHHFEWRGEYTYPDVTEYWCPTEGNWTECSGPCPGGDAHDISRKKIVRMKKMCLIDRG